GAAREDGAEGPAQVSVGVPMQGPKSHTHPFERWPRDDYHGLAACFARLKHNAKRPEHRYPGAEGWWVGRTGEHANPRTGKPAPPQVPGGGALDVPDGKDRRPALAARLGRPGTPPLRPP